MKKIQLYKHKLQEDFIDSYDNEEIENDEISSDIVKDLADNSIKMSVHHLIEDLIERCEELDEESKEMIFTKDGHVNITASSAVDMANTHDYITDFKDKLIKTWLEFDVKAKRILGIFAIAYKKYDDETNSLFSNNNWNISPSTKLNGLRQIAENILNDNSLNHKDFVLILFAETVNNFVHEYKVSYLPGTNYCPHFVGAWLIDDIVPFINMWKKRSSDIINQRIHDTGEKDMNDIAFMSQDHYTYSEDFRYGGFIPMLKSEFQMLKSAEIMYHMLCFIEELAKIIKTHSLCEYSSREYSLHESTLNEDYVNSYDNEEVEDDDKVSDDILQSIKENHDKQIIEDTKEIVDNLIDNICNAAKEYDEGLEKCNHNAFFGNYLVGSIRNGIVKLTEEQIRDKQQEYFSYRFDNIHPVNFVHVKSIYEKRTAFMKDLVTIQEWVKDREWKFIRDHNTVVDLVTIMTAVKRWIEDAKSTIGRRCSDFDLQWDEMVDQRKKYGLYDIDEDDRREKDDYEKEYNQRFFRDMVRTTIKNKKEHKLYQLFNNILTYHIDALKQLQEMIDSENS